MAGRRFRPPARRAGQAGNTRTTAAGARSRAALSVPPLLGLLLILPRAVSDVDVLREDGSTRVATVVQDSAIGWDTTVYPHCVFVDNPQFVAIDSDASNTLSEAELTADGAQSLLYLDRNGDALVDLLEFAAGASAYLSLKGLAAASVPNPNITCATCASGWQGVHCNEPMTPVEIKIAVRASQAYFSAQKQEALRRALALGVQWNQVRVRVDLGIEKCDQTRPGDIN
jgi:hypothetical protein